ncbi:MAG: hypothetical protein QXX83_06765 [Thermofilum sp.]
MSSGNAGLARGAPSWVLSPSLLGGRVWLSVEDGLRVLGVNGARTAAVDVQVGCECEGRASAAVEASLLSSFAEPLMAASPLLDLEVSERLVVRFHAGRAFAELSLPAEREEVPLRSLPEPRLRAPAYGVFEEAERQLRRLKGSSGVRVRVRAGEGSLLVEPPRRLFKLEGAPAEPLEVRVLFGDLEQVLEVFRAAGLKPQALWLGSRVLGLEAVAGKARAVALVAGQVE